MRAFSSSAHHHAFWTQQREAIWSLLLPADSEGPTFISLAAAISSFFLLSIEILWHTVGAWNVTAGPTGVVRLDHEARTMQFPQRTQYKHCTKPYRVHNWPEYDKSLRRRGDLTIWLSEDAVTAWTAPTRRRPGGQRIYANIAIETALPLRMVFHLPLRQTEGFLRSLSALLDLNIPIPDHTTLSRRGKVLGRLPVHGTTTNRPLHLLIDSTGLAVHVGHLRKPPKKRAWRKLHVGVDAKTGDIVTAELTASVARDAARVPALLKQLQRPLASVAADAAYDSARVYQAIENHTTTRSPRVLIPPKKNALVSNKAGASRQRNRNIRSRNRHGQRDWQRASGYSRRAMVENSFYRYKAIVGPAMRSRTLAGQRVEARLGVKILNLMTSCGNPDSYRVG